MRMINNQQRQKHGAHRSSHVTPCSLIKWFDESEEAENPPRRAREQPDIKGVHLCQEVREAVPVWVVPHCANAEVCFSFVGLCIWARELR